MFGQNIMRVALSNLRSKFNQNVKEIVFCLLQQWRNYSHLSEEKLWIDMESCILPMSAVSVHAEVCFFFELSHQRRQDLEARHKSSAAVPWLGMYGVAETFCLFIHSVVSLESSEHSSQQVGAGKRSNVYIDGERYPADWWNVGLSSNSHCEDGCWDAIQIEMRSSWNRHLAGLWVKMCSHAGNRCGKCGVNGKGCNLLIS